jgi:transposase
LNDVDILGPSDRRHIRTAQEKVALLAEVDAEGGKVRLVARRHNISESLIYNWRSARKAAAVAMGEPENVEFIPAGVIEGLASRAVSTAALAEPEREPEPSSQSGASKTGAIEITLPNGTRLNVDTSVCAKETKIFAEFIPCDKNPRTIHKSELERPDNALGRPPFTVNVRELEP